MKKIIFALIIGIVTTLICFPVFAVSPEPIKAQHAMVVTTQQLASEVGIEILKAGGNAIDAAVAVGYALAVVEPCCGNIGGGGFMTIHLANGKNTFLNFREQAPLAATANMYLDNKGDVIANKITQGYLAVAIPGTVMGLDTALKKYGTMTRKQVMAPAIRLAEQGFILTTADTKLLTQHTDDFRKEANIAAIFLKNNQPYEPGDKLVQTQLADTLTKIADQGSDYFYKGPIATEIAKASQARGGIITLDDFAHYKVEELAPVQCDYRGYQIISAPPPSSGGITLCEMLNILEAYPLSYLGYHSAQSIHYISEAMRHAFVDRNQKLGDPDFIKNPIEQLISKKYAAEIQKQIQTFRATPSSDLSAGNIPYESTQTTHYSIVDNLGNAVAVTFTIDSFFGAKVIAGNTGFFLNDEMDDFSAKPNARNQFGLVQGAANSIAPGKRPLSSMTPTIVMKDNQLVLVLGSPGGPRIITAVLQTLLNVIDYHMNIQEAVDAPRFHHQWLPDVIDTEPMTFSKDTAEKLATMGYFLRDLNQFWGAVEAIEIDPTTKALFGANDDRKPGGKAVGY